MAASKVARRRFDAVEDSGRREDDGAGAHRRRPLRGGVNAAQPPDDARIGRRGLGLELEQLIAGVDARRHEGRVVFTGTPAEAHATDNPLVKQFIEGVSDPKEIYF